MKKQFLLLAFLLSLLHFSCGVEEYDMDKVSMDSLMIETSLDAPLATSELSLKDVFLHRGSSGFFVTEDAKYDLANITSEEQIPLPAMVLSKTAIDAVDSLKGVNFSDALGSGNVLDSIIEARLKFDIRNELPFDIDITVKFVCQDSFIVTTRPLVKTQKKYVSESLTRTIQVAGSDIDATSREMVRASVDRKELRFGPADNAELKKVKDILMEYHLHLPVNRAYVIKNYKFKAQLSAFMRANLSLND